MDNLLSDQPQLNCQKTSRDHNKTIFGSNLTYFPLIGIFEAAGISGISPETYSAGQPANLSVRSLPA